MKNHNAREYRRILIVRLDRLGDVVLSTPVIKNVRAKYPSSWIAFLARPYTQDVVKGNPDLDEVITYDKNGDEKTFTGNLSFILKLIRKKFDIAIILHPTARTHLITFLSMIPRRVGYDKKLGFLLTKRIPHTKQLGLKHELDYTLDILRYIGIEPGYRKLYVPVDPLQEARIKNILARHDIYERDKLLVVNPGASCRSKMWASENFAKAADSLIGKFGFKAVIISDSKDIAFADRTARAMKSRSVNLAGMTTVKDIAAILKLSSMFISNDSGPVHIACAMGTRTIVIFGRKDPGLSPVRWGPLGEEDIALHKDVGCERCLAHDCNIAFRCLEAVTVEDVVASADKLLAKA